MSARAAGGAPPQWKVLVAATAVAASLVVLWSLATPLMAAPDEPAQLVAAAAVARGEIFPPAVTTPFGVQYSVQLPRGLATVSALPICYAFHPDVPASCAPNPGTSRRPAAATTQFANYPPPYYLVVGLATLGGPGASSVWAARAVSDWLVVLLLGLAAYLLRRYHPRRAVLLGLAVAVTPQVLFLGSVVGDSGLEIAASLATWAGVLCIVDRPDPPPAPLVWLTTFAAVVLATARPLSPLFLAVIALVASRSGRPGLAGRLVAERTVRRGLWTVTGAVLLAVGWLALRGAPHLLSPPGGGPESVVHRLGLAWHLVGAHLAQLVGVLGWTDTPLSPVTEVCWLAALVALLVAARPHRLADRLAPTVVAGLVIGLPFLQTAASGVPTQGRDVLPLAVGIPLLMARTIPQWRTPAVAVPGLVAVGQLATYFRGLRRYGVGLAGPLLPLHPAWQPPLHLIPLALTFLAAVVAAAVGVHRAAGITRPPGRSPGRARGRSPGWSLAGWWRRAPDRSWRQAPGRARVQPRPSVR